MFFKKVIFTAVAISGIYLAADDLSVGNRAFFAGDYRNAVKYYEDHLRRADHRKDGEAWISGARNLGMAYLHCGETEKARALLKSFKSRYPSRNAGLFEAKILIAEKNFSAAEKLLSALKTSDPESEDARRCTLAMVFMNTNRIPQAYQLFSEVSGRIGEALTPYSEKDAVNALKSGKMNEAQRMIGRIAARPESSWKYYAAAEAVYALIRMNKISDAVTILAEIPADKYTADTELLRYLAEARQGNYRNLKKNFAVFMEKLPPRPQPRLLELFSAAAEAAVNDKDPVFAAMIIAEAVKFSNDPAHKMLLSRQLIKILTVSDPAAAAAAATAYFSAFPADKNRFQLLTESGAGLFHRKNFREAMQVYLFAYQQCSGKIQLEIAGNIVSCAENIPDFTVAEKFSRVIFAARPEDIAARSHYAGFLEKYGKTAAAEKELLAAVAAAGKLGNQQLADKQEFALLCFYLRYNQSEKIRQTAEKLERSTDVNYVSAAKFEIGELLEKSAAYLQAKKYFTDTEKLNVPQYAAKAAFKTALMSYKEAIFDRAAQEFFYCAEKYPEYEKNPEALFMAYTLFEMFGDSRAQTAAALLRKNHPAHKAFATMVLDSAAKIDKNSDIRQILDDLALVDKNFASTGQAEEARLLTARITLQRGSWQEAMNILQTLHDSKNPTIAAESLLRTGEIYFSQRNYQQAEAFFRRSAAAHPVAPGSSIAILRAADAVLAMKNPDKQKLEMIIADLEHLAENSRFNNIKQEAGYKAGCALKRIGKNPAAAARFEKNVYTAADMYDRGIEINSLWTLKSCESALELLLNERGNLQKGMRLIEECSKALPDYDIEGLKEVFRNKMSKKRR